MRRGFLNTPPPPRPKPSPQEKPSSPHPSTQDGGEEAVAGEDAMDVMAAVGDVSDGGNRVVAVRTTRSTEGDAESPPSLEDDNNTGTDPPSNEPTGKEKEKVADTDDDAMNTPADGRTPPVSFLPPRPIPRHQDWGRSPDEDFFHMVPRSHGGPYRKRAVFRLWPRDPNGKALMPTEQPTGKLSPDGYPWGATLYDFYNVNRLPTNRYVVSIMTGSAIWEAMKELGELDVAVSEIEWAKSEGEPRVVGVANTEALIESIERRSQLLAYRKFSMLGDVRRTALPIRTDKEDEVGRASAGEKGGHAGKHDEEHNKEDVVKQVPEDDNEEGGDSNEENHNEEEEAAPAHGNEEEDGSEVEYDNMDVYPAFIPPPSKIPVTSPFHPSHYPKPWPFIPFENPLSILLQERIPLYLLPQTLYVHDPFNLLPAQKRVFRDTSWMAQPDIIQTYNLDLSESIRKEVKEAEREAEELERFKARTLIILRYKRTKEQIKNHEPVIEVPLPPYSRRMTKVEESHLYLSPVAKVGEGHHSIVYKGEWELPRDLFTRPKICRQCFKETVDKEIRRLKDTGRWEKMLRAAAWGPTGFTGRQPTQAELDEVSDSIDLERNGEIIEREITCIVPPNASPSQIIELVDKGNIWDMFKQARDTNALHLNFTGDGDEGESTKGSYVTVRIDPPFSYGSQKTCTHGPRRFATPRTAKFTVVAKLSLGHDRHLAREASNYQQFPQHLFHHYNGYTLIRHLDTVPVNAVVPQFYGFYMPKEGTGELEPYLSPILLVEHCGEPIDPEKLSVEDQDECLSLLLRFQRAGWLHESVAPRNFLVQPGKPTEFPIERQYNPEPSFRLIDFGRSRKFKDPRETWAEELEGFRMFERFVARKFEGAAEAREEELERSRTRRKLLGIMY